MLLLEDTHGRATVETSGAIDPWKERGNLSEPVPHTEYGPVDGLNYETAWKGVYLDAHLATHVGLKRKNNEDSCAVCAPEAKDLSEQCGFLFAVADGMGGALAGEHASRIALQTLVSAYYAQPGMPIPFALREAVGQANDLVFNEAHSNPDYSGMGTTVSALVIQGSWAYIAQVGDSRVYLLREQAQLLQITRDHSLVAEQVRNGIISEEEARTHSLRNLITRAVGIKPQVDVDIFVLRLQKGDTLLLCSDGLSGLVSDFQIGHVLRADSLALITQDLIDKALHGGGNDNITTVAVRVIADPPLTERHDGAEEVYVPTSGWFRRMLHHIF